LCPSAQYFGCGEVRRLDDRCGTLTEAHNGKRSFVTTVDAGRLFECRAAAIGADWQHHRLFTDTSQRV
jgi:hypothetical protein